VIIEFLINVFVGIIMGFFDMIEISGIPFLSDTAALLSEFCVYGSYVVGADMMLLFAAMIVTWTTAKLTVALGVRIWELLPLT